MTGIFAIPSPPEGSPLEEVYGLLQRGDAVEAARACERIDLSMRQDYTFWTYYGVTLSSSGLHSEAIQAFSEASKLQPLMFTSSFNLGCAFEMAGQNEKALICWKKSLALNPKFERARTAINLGTCQYPKTKIRRVWARIRFAGRSRAISLAVIIALAILLTSLVWRFCCQRHFPQQTVQRPRTLRPRVHTVDKHCITLAFTGDVCPIGVNASLGQVADSLKSADIAFCNLECPISDRGSPNHAKFRRGKLMGNEYLFRALPKSVVDLTEGGIDVVSLANNHTMDYGPSALSDTMASLSSKGIAYVGAGTTKSDARRCAIIRRNGVRVAYLAYVLANTLPAARRFAAGDKTPGVALLSRYTGSNTYQILRNDIAAARRLADTIIVSYHWGQEGCTEPAPLQRVLAHMTIRLGADMIVGHHPHSLQGMEIYNGKPIIYSLGNFVFHTKKELLQQTGVLSLEANKQGIGRATFHAARIEDAIPHFVDSDEAEKATRNMHDLSRDLGTPEDSIQTSNSELSITVNQRARPQSFAKTYGLVEVNSIIPDVTVDMQYAGAGNRFGRAMYKVNRSFLRIETALKLAEAERILAKQGFKLKIWDSYRPISVQKAMWKVVPDARYVANPSGGSNHNRGAAVDVTLTDSRGRDLPMQTEFDDFTEKARTSYEGAPDDVRKNVGILRQAMQAAGFRPLSTEWWHFDDTDARDYPLLDVPFETILSSSKP